VKFVVALGKKAVRCVLPTGYGLNRMESVNRRANFNALLMKKDSERRMRVGQNSVTNLGGTEF
jgi:hypothetical protein